MTNWALCDHYTIYQQGFITPRKNWRVLGLTLPCKVLSKAGMTSILKRAAVSTKTSSTISQMSHCGSISSDKLSYLKLDTVLGSQMLDHIGASAFGTVWPFCRAFFQISDNNSSMFVRRRNWCTELFDCRETPSLVLNRQPQVNFVPNGTVPDTLNLHVCMYLLATQFLREKMSVRGVRARLFHVFLPVKW